ncbi:MULTISPECIES: metal ABC transporter ATP-binding protein [Modicisalibacter]|uniref:metal ABC transporter ATP-binding protein n=1 Tax=Modicisalibacter TaxID=574347 RepID=UPI00100B8B11|nr:MULTISPECIES: metal ABC transporter ATP-binding protein [Halomonadaceae]MBZ9558453.1 metal ABC transporter ATP-binding protein [Modicisalibacter sp. R2A 31.J]MBZ9575655.1 metal ABC transporter ATP-binding protein [Modicisalibacter sp. MOD 31.J]
MALLTLEHCDIRLGGHRVLEAIDLTLERGEIVAVIGPNGSGKSTLLKSILGSLTPSRGRIHKPPGLRIGYVPQRLSLDATLPMTVSRFLQLPGQRASPRIGETLAQAGAEGLERSQMSELSGGQLQRVLLARALLKSPDLLLLDEATQGLDHRGIADFYRRLEPIRQTLDCGLLMVSHELQAALAASDRVVCLNRSIHCQGTPAHVAASPAYRALFGPEPRPLADTTSTLPESSS